jgi:hypothetical protein
VSASQRLKGASAEREVVQILHRHGWGFAERTSRGVAQIGCGDIAHGPAGVHLEVKRSERLNICAALDQAIRDAHELDIPVVVHRPSRHVWMATLPLEELLPLLRLKEFG